jgi:hypothetical protein
LKDSRSSMCIRGAGCAMAKETKFLRTQVEKPSEGREQPPKPPKTF